MFINDHQLERCWKQAFMGKELVITSPTLDTPHPLVLNIANVLKYITTEMLNIRGGCGGGIITRR